MVDLGINLGQLGLEFGSSAVIGGIIGFTAKKVAKVIAVIVGLELALFKFLESRGIMNVNWEKLSESGLTFLSGLRSTETPSWLMSILSTLSVSAGFSGGFLLGFKKG